ncbi:hypothetical protein [Microbispora rosea]
MILTTHLDYLREQLAKAERVADGWRAIVSYAEANAIGTSLSMARPCDCGLPGTPGMVHRNDGLPCTPVPPDPGMLTGHLPPDSGVLTGQHPYPPAAGQGDPRSAWTPEHERSFQGFEQAHKELAEETGGKA